MGAQLTYLDEPHTAKDFGDGGCLEKYGVRHGSCGMQGWRRNMEDAHIAVDNFDDGIGLYGVFDGHGGKAVSQFAAKHFAALLKERMTYKSGDYKRALEETFLEIDVRLRTSEGRQELRGLDQPDPNKEVSPIMIPKSVVHRFMPTSKIVAEPDKEKITETDSDDGEKSGQEENVSENIDQSDSNNIEVGEDVAIAKDSVAAAVPFVGDDEAEAVQADGEDEDLPELELVNDDEGEDEIDLNELDEEDAVGDLHDNELVAINPAAFASEATPEAQGCTAVVVLVVRSSHGDRRVFCANAGDSRAVMSRGGAVVALSDDQKPECPVEVARIQKAGGYVEMDAAGGPRVQGDLNLSRAFGDLRYKQGKLPAEEQILTAFPEVRHLPLTEDDEFIIIGCDGIWEMMSNKQAVDFVRSKLQMLPDGEPLSSVCADIVTKVMCPSMDSDENPEFDGHGCDNMTVTIVQLKASMCSASPDEALCDAAAAAEQLAREEASAAYCHMEPDAKRPRLAEANGSAFSM